MEKYPKRYADHLEQKMVKAVGRTTRDECMASRFAKAKIAVEKQKKLGFFVEGLCQIHWQLYLQENEAAREAVLLLLSAADQCCLDGNWETTLVLTQLPRPRWAVWQTADAQLLRKEYPYSSLVKEEWISDIVNRAATLEALAKRRQKK